MIIGEMWTARLPIEKLKTVIHAADVPERGEALNLIGINKEGTCIELTAHFTRQDGKVVLGPEERLDGRSLNLIVPFREALGLAKQSETPSTASHAPDGPENGPNAPSSTS